MCLQNVICRLIWRGQSNHSKSTGWLSYEGRDLGVGIFFRKVVESNITLLPALALGAN